jgi:hypothetical protein
MHATIKLGLPTVLLLAVVALSSYTPVVSAGETSKELVNVGNGLCLGSTHIDGKRWLTLTEECGGQHQRWYVEPLEFDNRYVQIESHTTGKCLQDERSVVSAQKCVTSLGSQFWVREEISPGSTAARYRSSTFLNMYLTSAGNGSYATMAPLGTTEEQQALQIWLD